MCYVNMRVKLLSVILFQIFVSKGFVPVQCSAAEFIDTVPKIMFLWTPKTRYETTLRVDFKAHGVTVNGNASGKIIKGSSLNPLVYTSILKYSTELLDGNEDEGQAYRYYETAINSRICADTDITVDGFSLAEMAVGLFKNLPDQTITYDIISKDVVWEAKRVLNPGILTIRPKKGSVVDEVDQLKPMIELIPSLKNSAFILNWRSGTQIRNAALSVSYSDSIQQAVTDKAPPEIVKDVIRRESSLLYNAALGGAIRKDGDVWSIDGSVLGGLIYPTLNSAFKGRIVVRATKIVASDEALLRHKPSGAKVDEAAREKINGLRLSFIPEGIIDKKRVTSNLCYDTKTADGGNRKIEVDFSKSEKVKGGMIIDTDYQMIRQAFIEVNDGSFRGSIPCFGTLTVNATVTSGIDLKLIYDCIRVPQ